MNRVCYYKITWKILQHVDIKRHKNNWQNPTLLIAKQLASPSPSPRAVWNLAWGGLKIRGRDRWCWKGWSPEAPDSGVGILGTARNQLRVWGSVSLSHRRQWITESEGQMGHFFRWITWVTGQCANPRPICAYYDHGRKMCKAGSFSIWCVALTNVSVCCTLCVFNK